MKILICLLIVWLITGCSVSAPESEDIMPEPSVGSLQDFDKSLLEGILMHFDDESIKIRDLQDGVGKQFAVEDKVISDISKLKIAVGDRIVLKVEDYTATRIEKVL